MTFCEAGAVQPKGWFPEHPEQSPLPQAQPSPPLADPSPSGFLQQPPLTPPNTSPAAPGACPCPGLHHNLPCPEQNQEGHCYKGRESRPLSGRGGDLLGVLLAFPACISFREKGFWLSLAAPQHKCFAHQ